MTQIRIRYGLFLLLIGMTASFHAEELPTLPILALVIKSDEIWEAEPLHPDSTLIFSKKTAYNKVEWLRVRLTTIYRSQKFGIGDTVWVSIGGIYSWPNKGDNAGTILGKNDTISRLLLFCRGWTAEQYRETYSESPEQHFSIFANLNLSGIRLVDHRQNLYYPIQKENPGNFHFSRSTRETWLDLQAQTKCAIRRVDTLFSIRAIENPIVQNDSLFSWIRCHAAELADEYSANGWYWYRDLPFVWILCNGITEQAWEAIVLYHHLFSGAILTKSSWSSLGELPDPFCDVGSLIFLIEKIKQRDLAHELRHAALQIACWNTELPDSARTDLFHAIAEVYTQTEMETRESVVHAAASLAFSKKEQPVPDALLFFMDARSAAPPGDLRNTLSEIVVRNCSAAEWEAISGNEGRMLVTLYSFYYDSLKNSIHFHVYQQFGTEHLYEHPILEWFQTDEKSHPVNRHEQPLPVTYPKIDWENGSLHAHGAASVELFVGDSPGGKWHFRVKGTAGRERQFRWQSEPAIFEWQVK